MFLLEKVIGLAVSRMAALSIVEVHLLPSKVHTGPEGPRGDADGGRVQQLDTVFDPQGNGEPQHSEEISKVQDAVQPSRGAAVGRRRTGYH